MNVQPSAALLEKMSGKSNEIVSDVNFAVDLLHASKSAAIIKILRAWLKQNAYAQLANNEYLTDIKLEKELLC